MKIVVLGAGPSGVYLAISMKLKDPGHDITVYERNRDNDTFGWGVVFSDQTMANLQINDPTSAKTMTQELIHWDDIAVHHKGDVVRSGGHGFMGIGRLRLLEILYQRARDLGVNFQFETEFEVADIDTKFADADLIVAADGLNSKIRNHDLEAFDCDIEMRPNKFVWMGTHQRFEDAFTFIFEKTEHGWLWVHAYQFDDQTSTFIVECNPETYAAFGFEYMDHMESAEVCRKIFEKYLGGHDLMTKSAHIRGSAWINFPRVLCHQWIKGNVVLIGDAAHTAHFSIGSGTKLGFEDAISLANHLNSGENITKALRTYQDERELEALKLQSAARNSMEWFEEIERYLDYDSIQFTYALLTRSQRVSHENLRLRDKDWLEGVEKDFAEKAMGRSVNEPIPPMFTPYKLRAHFSIGSGTKLGFEDAISLANHLNSGENITKALRTYQDERELEALKLQSAARNSMEWFEEIERYLDYDSIQFTYALLTRSQRVSHENLRLRDKDWLEGVEKDFAEKAMGRSVNEPIPPMFTPYKLRGMELKNRVVVSPMSMYSAKDGLIDDFHFVHYGARAMGGAGLMYTEMTDVSSAGRITPGCAGIYTDEQEAAWKRVVEYVHDFSDCKIALQLGHAGRKGSTKVGWEGYDMPLDEGNWELLAPSPIKWDKINQVPREMTEQDFDQVLQEFVEATKRAEAAGFDMIELHAAHGYLLSSFITPVSNQRTDEYGGSLENRLRFPLRVLKAMRAVWPAEKPISVRISSTDWVGDKGVTPQEAVLIGKAFVNAGADIIDVSAGQTLPGDQVAPVFGRMFQTPMSDRIRNEAHVTTMAVGNIYETDHVNSILAAGRADLVLLARPHLMDPSWTIRSAAELEYHGDAVTVPKQYITAFTQMETNLKRAAEMALNA